jgi:hypothetical protein
MNKKSNPVAAETAFRAKTAKVSEAKQGPARKTAKDRPAETPEFDFIGKVESIGVTAVPGKPPFTFGMKGRNGARRTFQIPAAENAALMVMAAVVTTAHAAGTKLGIRVGAGDEVVDVQCRPRLGKKD